MFLEEVTCKYLEGLINGFKMSHNCGHVWNSKNTCSIFVYVNIFIAPQALTGKVDQDSEIIFVTYIRTPSSASNEATAMTVLNSE